MKPVLYLLLGLALLGAARADDPELKRLNAAFDAAQTQSDLNDRSSDLAQYLDRKLNNLEDTVRKDLDVRASALFAKTAKTWRSYRDGQAESEGEVYRGGSIQPLIYNQAYIRITKERIAALANYDPEGPRPGR